MDSLAQHQVKFQMPVHSRVMLTQKIAVNTTFAWKVLPVNMVAQSEQYLKLVTAMALATAKIQKMFPDGKLRDLFFIFFYFHPISILSCFFYIQSTSNLHPFASLVVRFSVAYSVYVLFLLHYFLPTVIFILVLALHKYTLRDYVRLFHLKITVHVTNALQMLHLVDIICSFESVHFWVVDFFFSSNHIHFQPINNH